MRSIWMSRLGRASIALAIAGLAIAAGGAGAEARDYGYYDGWRYHHYYSHPSWGHRYYYGYAPRYYYAPPAYAYSPEPYYYGPSFNLTVPLR